MPIQSKNRLETDHRPLQSTYSTKSKPSARIVRWVLRLQSYNFKVEYKSGTQNVADSLSRLLKGGSCSGGNGAKDHIYFVAKKSVPKAMTARGIEEAAAVDQVLIAVRECIKSDRWKKCPNTAYKALRDELTCLGKLVLRGSNVVAPGKLRQRVMNTAHECYRGMVKTKEKLRTRVWWPETRTRKNTRGRVTSVR